MRGKTLPRWQSGARRFYRAIDILCRALRHRCELFASGGVSCLKISSRRRCDPFITDEMSEAALMPVEPCQGFARILRRGAVFHGHEFFNNAHVPAPALRLLNKSFPCSGNRMAIVCRITSRDIVFELTLDIREHAADAKAEQLRFHPRRAQLFFH